MLRLQLWATQTLTTAATSSSRLSSTAPIFHAAAYSRVPGRFRQCQRERFVGEIRLCVVRVHEGDHLELHLLLDGRHKGDHSRYVANRVP